MTTVASSVAYGQPGDGRLSVRTLDASKLISVIYDTVSQHLAEMHPDLPEMYWTVHGTDLNGMAFPALPAAVALSATEAWATAFGLPEAKPVSPGTRTWSGRPEGTPFTITVWCVVDGEVFDGRK